MMKVALICLHLLLGGFCHGLSQTSIYLGGGISHVKTFKNQSGIYELGLKKNWLTAPDLSLLTKSVIGKDLSLSLGIVYNFNGFESPLNGCICLDPIIYLEFLRYGIPLKIYWNAYRGISLSGGVMLNNIYREVYTYSSRNTLEFEKTKPEIAFNAGLSGEWRNFLVDLAVTRSVFNPEALGDGQYWILDFNVYYKVLSSKPK